MVAGFYFSAGGRVPLHGFKGFLGGLDSDRDLTGELSVYTKFQNLEIMFHVSTLLPFSPKDSQQVLCVLMIFRDGLDMV